MDGWSILFVNFNLFMFNDPVILVLGDLSSTLFMLPNFDIDLFFGMDCNFSIALKMKHFFCFGNNLPSLSFIFSYFTFFLLTYKTTHYILHIKG